MTATPSDSLISRRRLVKTAVGAGLAAVSLGVGAAVWAKEIELHWVEFVRRDLPIRRLPADLIGKTLVLIADLHAGPTDAGYLADVLDQVADLRPELTVIAGDLTHNGLDAEIKAVCGLLAERRLARVETLAILGNHDYGTGWKVSARADTLTRQLRGTGVTVLRNERRITAGVQMIGLDDYWSPHFRPKEVLPGRDREMPTLVLSHNPDTADRPIWEGYKGWILSGHTHGGQVGVPLLDYYPFLPVRNKRYVAGEYDVGEGRRLYINRGLGCGRQARLAARPEVTVFTLQREG